jgi:hypothetical protein
VAGRRGLPKVSYRRPQAVAAERLESPRLLTRQIIKSRGDWETHGRPDQSISKSGFGGFAYRLSAQVSGGIRTAGHRPPRTPSKGQLPLNSFGGQLSAGSTHGYGFIHEAVVRLRGEGGAPQVVGAEVGVVSIGGGTAGGCFPFTAAR